MEAFDTLTIESLAEEDVWINSALKSRKRSLRRKRVDSIEKSAAILDKGENGTLLSDLVEDANKALKEKQLLKQIQKLYKDLEKVRETKNTENGMSGGSGKLIIASSNLPADIFRSISYRGHEEEVSWELRSHPVTELVLNPQTMCNQDLGFQNVHWVGYPNSFVEPAEQYAVREFLASPDNCKPITKVSKPFTEKREGNTVPLTMSGIFMDNSLRQSYYEGFCKSVLWPLFHSIVPTADFLIDAHDNEYDVEMSEERMWQAYITANQNYADEIREIFEEGDVIWIHGYHLMLLPHLLRASIPNAKIGFFMHIPFPSSEFFRILTYREELLHGVLGSTLIGFQTFNYARHFLSVCTRILGLISTPLGVESSSGHFTKVTILPVGVNTAPLKKLARTTVVQLKMKQLRTDFKDKVVFVGIDKIVLSSGVIHKLIAFEEMLSKHPEIEDRVVLVQVMCGRCDEALVSRIHQLVARINGKFGSLSGHGGPIFIVDHRNVDSYELLDQQIVALLSVADVLLVTPLRDGMGVRPFQYIACRDSIGEHSNIVLSEFAGAAHSLGSGCLLINPWDTNKLSESLLESFLQPKQSKRSRHLNNVKIAAKSSGSLWSSTFLKQLEAAFSDAMSSSVIKELDIRDLCTAYYSSRNRILLFDTEGVLVQPQSLSELTAPSKEIISLLQQLSNDPSNTIIVISRRLKSVVEDWFKDLPIALAAEGGAFLKWGPSYPWISLVDDEFTSNTATPGEETPTKVRQEEFYESTLAIELNEIKPSLSPAKSNNIEAPSETIELGQHHEKDAERVTALPSDSINTQAWREEILPLMQYYVERTPGSTIESMETALAWHYYDANPEHGKWQANNLMISLNEFCNRLPIAVTAESFTIKVQLPSVSKLRVLISVMQQMAKDDNLHYPETPYIPTLDGEPFKQNHLEQRIESTSIDNLEKQSNPMQDQSNAHVLDCQSFLDMVLVLTSGEDSTDEPLFGFLNDNDEEESGENDDTEKQRCVDDSKVVHVANSINKNQNATSTIENQLASTVHEKMKRNVVGDMLMDEVEDNRSCNTTLDLQNIGSLEKQKEGNNTIPQIQNVDHNSVRAMIHSSQPIKETSTAMLLRTNDGNLNNITVRTGGNAIMNTNHVNSSVVIGNNVKGKSMDSSSQHETVIPNKLKVVTQNNSHTLINGPKGSKLRDNSTKNTLSSVATQNEVLKGQKASSSMESMSCTTSIPSTTFDSNTKRWLSIATSKSTSTSSPIPYINSALALCSLVENAKSNKTKKDTKSKGNGSTPKEYGSLNSNKLISEPRVRLPRHIYTCSVGMKSSAKSQYVISSIGEVEGLLRSLNGA